MLGNFNCTNCNLEHYLLCSLQHIRLVSFMLELAKKITKNVQERLSSLTVDKPLKVLIEEEIKRECQGPDQSSQSTHEKIQENYTIS